jgi:predicted nucleotidyltransferase
MTPESEYLLNLAKRNVQAYLPLPQVRAAMVTGSVALGLSDHYSDIDMMIYYDALPSDDQLLSARLRNGGTELLWRVDNRTEGELMESYRVQGVECQIAHATIAAWERDMAIVLEQHDVKTPLHKALSGTLEGIPLYGTELINAWKDRIANYPPALAQAMVEQHLQFFPLWSVQPQLAARDAKLWHYQILTEASNNLLAIVAGLNRQYFTTFQFKRMQHFVTQLSIAPFDFASRLDRLFTAEFPAAALELEALVGETIDLVAQHMPQIDVSNIRQKIGQRKPGWKFVE